MTTAIDFRVIQDDTLVTIGDSGGSDWEEAFKVAKMKPDTPAVLSLMVRGLNFAESAVDVEIENDSITNSVVVGAISTYPGGDHRHWHSQTIHIGRGILNAGENRIKIRAALHPQGSGSSQAYDDFDLKDVILYYRKEV